MPKPDMPKGITERGGSYRVSVMVDGVRKTGTRPTLAQAVVLQEKLREDARVNSVTDASHKWDLSTGIENYIEQKLLTNGGTDSSAKTYRSNGNGLIRHFGENTRLDTISSGSLVEYATVARQGDALTINTIKQRLILLRSVMSHARRMGGMTGQLPEFPSLRVRKVKARFLSIEEEEELISYFETEKKPLLGQVVAVMIDTGMRVGRECLGLRWEDIDLKERKVYIWDSKGVEPRAIPLTSRPFSILSLLRLNKARAPGPFHPLVYNDFLKEWNRARKWLGRDDDNQYTPHITRHTFCTRLVSAGVDLVTVQYLAGHTEIKTTLGYAHFAPERNRSAIAALEGNSTGPVVVPLTNLKG